MVSGGCFKRGTWTAEEDALLLAFVQEHGRGSWNTAHLLFPNLLRSGKSCRLRYLNQLHPGIRRASITPSEECFILKAHSLVGNQWSLIASLLPGRTDNTVKNVVNMRLKRARRHAASVNYARRAARILSEQQVYAPSLSGMHGSLETYNHISLPTSACGVSVPPPPQVAMEGMHGTWRCSTSSPGRYTALVTGGGAPTTMQTYSPMLVTESKRVAPSERTHFDAAPATSNEWVMQALHSVREPLSSSGRLPSVQKPFESFQLPSVQKPFESFQLPSVQEPLQSLQGSELPSVQEHFQSLSLGSELPSVQAQHQQVEMAYRSSNRVVGDNDLLEAIKLTGYCSSSSSNSSASGPSSPASSLYYDDSYLNTLLMGMEAGHQLSTMSSPASSSESLLYDLPNPTSSLFDVSSSLQIPAEEEHPGALIDSLMSGGIDGELASMMLSSNTWSSMPGACHVGESASGDFMPDFN